MDRNNVCVGCHVEIPEQSLEVSVLHHISAKLDVQRPVSHDAHDGLLRKTLPTAAWVQVLGLLAAPLGFLGGVWIAWRRLPA